MSAEGAPMRLSQTPAAGRSERESKATERAESVSRARTSSPPASSTDAAPHAPAQTMDQPVNHSYSVQTPGVAFAIADLVMRPWFEAQSQMVRMWKTMTPPLPLGANGLQLTVGAGDALPGWSLLPNPLQLAALPLLRQPESDLAECRNCYELTVDLPGVDPEQLEVRCGPGMIMVIGEKHEDSESERLGLSLAERRFGRFERTFSLPADADACNAQANYDDGVLLIRAPKVKAGRDGMVKVPIGR